ncbi:MAG TPA: hypothetical protein DEF75_00075 [Comamonas kerstersii]|nr:hypothetical protein [Comamonas kerstersii]
MDMRLTQDQHRLWVSSFFKSKVKEFDFFLRSVVECCDQSMDRFHKGQQGNEQTESRIVYTFSAFSNTVKTQDRHSSNQRLFGAISKDCDMERLYGSAEMQLLMMAIQ